MRARKFYQKTGKKIIIDGSNTAGYDKSKVECFNCHKMGHFARECRVPRSKDNRSWNQGNSSKTVRIEDASEKAMCAIDGGGFDWSDMAEDEIQANMALMAFSDSEVSCSKSCVLKYEALKKQYDDLLVKLDDTAFKASTYKRGLSILEAQVVKYKESEVLFSEEIALLKRSVGHKDYLMGLVKTELEKVKEEKEGVEFKLAKFEKSSKDLDDLLASQVTDKSKKGFGYNAVPSPHPLILNRPTPLDLSYSGLEEFQQPEINWYGPRDSSSKPTNVCNRESNNSKENIDDSLTLQPKSVTVSSTAVPTLKVDTKWKEKFFNHANNVRLEEPKKASENTDAPIIEDWVSDDEEEAESTPKVEKKIPIATKEASVNNDKPSRRTIRYAELYRSQRPRGNQRGWNGQKTDQLGCNFVFKGRVGCNFVFKNKACFICGNFDHIQYNCPNAYKHMVPRAVLMKTGLKIVKNTKPLSTVRSVNTARPVSTVRCVNTVRSHNTAHSKPTVSCARPKTHFQNQAQRATTNLNEKGLCIVDAQGTSLKHCSPLNSKEFDGDLLLLVEEQMEEKSLVKNYVLFTDSLNVLVLTQILSLPDESRQESSESNISTQKDQDCIFMPISKDAHTLENTPHSVDDVQLQGQDGNHDDSSFQDDGIEDHQVNTASPQVNTASPQVNTGSR
ncbi:putative ribonuclease H-like domain-containing protein [Tanacetum coccineum]